MRTLPLCQRQRIYTTFCQLDHQAGAWTRIDTRLSGWASHNNVAHPICKVVSAYTLTCSLESQSQMLISFNPMQWLSWACLLTLYDNDTSKMKPKNKAKTGQRSIRNGKRESTRNTKKKKKICQGIRTIQDKRQNQRCCSFFCWIFPPVSFS